MKKGLHVVGCVLLASLLTACDTFTKQDVGMVSGGAVGALVGSQIGGGSGRTAAIVLGTLAGAVVGGAIGRSMDKADQARTQQALESAQTNQPTSWKNPDTGNTYQVTPKRTYKKKDGGYCREYVTKATIAGKDETMYGKACRQPDGSWKVVS